MSTRTHTDDGTELHVEVSGSGDPVVLVHGITGSADDWAPLIPGLEATNTVIRFDLRGHGRSSKAATYDLASMASDIWAVARSQGAERPRLMGHSLGGALVTVAATMGPVESVVCLDQSLALGEFSAALAAVEPQLRDPATFPAVIDGIFGQMYGPLPEADRARLRAGATVDQEVVLAIWAPTMDVPAEETAALVDAVLSGVRVPYLALFGIDPGPGYAAWLAERVPGAECEVWDGLGHYLHWVETERVLDRLRRFWEG